MSAKIPLVIVAVLLFLAAAVGVSALGPFMLVPLGLGFFALSTVVP